ncbi:DUF1533 domain-containing protein [Eubacteriaceae bacterium ES2]|nr:DUF1533 domain-containing protein [Eubacteriaceae bacterium ES2]
MRKITVSLLGLLLALSAFIGTAIYAADENDEDLFVIDKEVSVEYSGHIQNLGNFPADGSYTQSPEVLGTEGQGLRLEALQIALTDAPEGLHIRYQIHVENLGWMDAVQDGEEAGTEGRGLRIEAIRIELVDDEGNVSPDYSVSYKGHIENIGESDWVSDGQELGTTGSGLRLEAIEIQIEKVPIDLARVAISSVSFLEAETIDYSGIIDYKMVLENIPAGPEKDPIIKGIDTTPATTLPIRLVTTGDNIGYLYLDADDDGSYNNGEALLGELNIGWVLEDPGSLFERPINRCTQRTLSGNKGTIEFVVTDLVDQEQNNSWQDTINVDVPTDEGIVPSLHVDSNNPVDTAIPITFSPDSQWEAAVSSVIVDETALDSAAYTVTDGMISLDPSKVTLLQSPGIFNITFIAEGYDDISLIINTVAGAISAETSTVTIDTPLAPNTTSTITYAAKDIYGNAVSGYQFRGHTVIVENNPTTVEKYTFAAPGKKGATITQHYDNKGLNPPVTDGNGISSFTVTLSETIDPGDGIAFQGLLGDHKTEVGSAFIYTGK